MPVPQNRYTIDSRRGSRGCFAAGLPAAPQRHGDTHAPLPARGSRWCTGSVGTWHFGAIQAASRSPPVARPVNCPVLLLGPDRKRSTLRVRRGRRKTKVIAVEATVAGAFPLAGRRRGSPDRLAPRPWLHRPCLQTFWQERRHYVAGTRWMAAVCAAVDWLVAVVLAIEIIAGAGFHH